MDIHAEVNKIIDGIVDGGRPRNSGPWPKAGAELMAELRALADDPEISIGLDLVTAMSGSGHEQAGQAFDEIVKMAATKAPTVAHCLQISGLSAYLSAQVMARAHYAAGDVAGGVKVIADMVSRLGFHHFPGNPAELNPDGTVTTAEGMSRPDYLQLADHAAAQRPAKPRGRPKGRRAAKRPPKRTAPEKARDACAMSLPAFCAKYYQGHYDLAVPKQRKAAWAARDRARSHARRS